MDLAILYNHYLWVKYGQEDMGNYKLHGNYGVGFKRYKSGDGNDCLVFYPCPKDRRTVPVTPYSDATKYMQGLKMIKHSVAPIVHRVVSQLSPHAPLEEAFASGAKKLIPMVYVHGERSSASECTAVAM